MSNASFFVRLIRVSWSVSLLSFSRSRNVTKTRSSSPFWHSGVFEYVLAVTDHSFELFFRRIVINGTSGTQRRRRRREKTSLLLSPSSLFPLSHLTMTFVEWDGGNRVLNEYFLGIGFGVGVPEEETRVKLLGDHRHLVATLTRLLWVGAIGG